jgi:hypothetical protein
MTRIHDTILGDPVPGLDRAADHIVQRLSIGLDDVLGGTHDKEWLLEEMRETVRYYAWLYIKAEDARTS